MLWLQTPPWGRWALALLVAGLAVWVEFRPDSMVDHPFATAPISPGEAISDVNTELRPVPAGLFGEIDGDGVAARDIVPGAPILADDLADADSLIPKGWWSVSVDTPVLAAPGDTVLVVLLDSGEVVEGVVTTPSSDDPFASTSAGIAVPPPSASEVAAAAANSRIAVLVSTD